MVLIFPRFLVNTIATHTHLRANNNTKVPKEATYNNDKRRKTVNCC